MNDGTTQNRARIFGRIFDFMPDSYLDRTSRPIYALCYLLGFIVFYEIGTIMINPEALSRSLSDSQIRVVSFVWVQNLISFLGFSGRNAWIAAPLAVLVILLAMQITSRSRWSIRLPDFITMTFECILWAIPLVVLSIMINRPAPVNQDVALAQLSPQTAAVSIDQSNVEIPILTSTNEGSQTSSLAADIVTGIGAGIYEELVFRLVLICLLMFLFQDILHLKQIQAVTISILIAALLFSAHHHIFFVYGHLQFGEPFNMVRFLFRAIAGIYFALLFAIRGFGITAATHAFYNIIATLLNTVLFAD